jgi:replicative DNA helicase
MNTQNIANVPELYNIEAEQALLGALMLNNESLRSVADFLALEHFYEPIHGEIYRVVVELVGTGKVATPITIRSFLDPEAKKFKAAEMSIGQYLAHLCAEATTIINAADYGRLVFDLFDRRKIMSVGAMLVENGDIDVLRVASEGIDALDQIVAKRSGAGTAGLNMVNAAVRVVDSIANAYQRDGKISGITTGLRDLDRKILGLQRGELVVLAGRPGMGKSALGTNIMRAAAQSGSRCLLWSGEMGDISLSERMISDLLFSRKPLPYWQLRSGRFAEADFRLVTEAAEEMALLPIRIEQQSSLTLAQISARARQLKRKEGLDLLMVDHLHLVKPSQRYAGNRVYELGETSSGLKALAKDLDCAVVALCQLSRQVEGREDKRPNLGDLRGSGDIEQDADTVIMLYRQAYYLERSQPPESDADKFAKWLADMEKAQNQIEAIIEKQRNGPIGMVKLFCQISCNAIRDSNMHKQQDLGI